MIFYFDSLGAPVSFTPERIFQGSNRANDIYLIAPAAPQCVASVKFSLPSGDSFGPEVMERCDELPDTIKNSEGADLAIWHYLLSSSVTAYPGAVSVQFTLTGTDGYVYATPAQEFIVERGVIGDEPVQGDSYQTVLDFVAQVNRKYDFASRFRALTLSSDKNIRKQIEEGFTMLPNGCSIIMEKLARQYILENIQSAIYNKSRIIREINSYGECTPTISQFLDNNGQDIRVLYQGSNCWTSLKRAAGKISYQDDEITKRLEKGVFNLIHHNTAKFLHFIDNFLGGSDDYLKKENEIYTLMFYYALFSEKLDKSGFNSVYDALSLLQTGKYIYFNQEIKEIVSYLLEHLQIKTIPLSDLFCSQMEVYGCYTREEIFTLVGRQTAVKKMQGTATGAFHLPEHNAFLLFVTLNKSDKDFSPSTQYNDYVINENLFHWQSWNFDSHQNEGGRRYINQEETQRKIILFVRENKKDGYGNTCPFHCFGLVNYVSSHGDFPMNVTWKLKEPVMPYYVKVI